jgi:hypothetical protein
MATTNRIAAQTLTQGGSVTVMVYPSEDTISMRLTTLVPFAAADPDPQVVMNIRPYVPLDLLRLIPGQAAYVASRPFESQYSPVAGSCVLNGAGSNQVFLTDFGRDTLGLLVEVTCLKGTAVIQVDEITGIEATGGQATVDTDDIANLSLATAKLAGGAVTPAKLSGFNTIKCLAFVGVAVPGPCACVGAAVGDRVIAMWGATTAAGAGLTAIPNNGTIFESVITVVDEVQQIQVADWSLITLIVLLAPAAA